MIFNVRKLAAPVLFGVLGAIGYLVRKKELASVFDPVTGLAAPGHKLSIATIVLAVLVCGLAVLVGFGVKKRSASLTWERAFSWDAPASVGGIATAIIFAVGVSVYFSGLWYSTAQVRWLEDLFVAFTAVGALCTVVLTFSMRSGKSGPITKICASTMPIFLCIWLLFFYRENAVNPVLLSFIWQCFGLGFLALGAYFYAGWLYGSIHSGATAAFMLAGEYLCIVSLADQTEYDNILLLAAVILWSMLCSGSLTGTAFSQKRG